MESFIYISLLKHTLLVMFSVFSLNVICINDVKIITVEIIWIHYALLLAVSF